MRFKDVMRKNPRLGILGFGVYAEKSLSKSELVEKLDLSRLQLEGAKERVIKISAWLRRNIEPTKTICKDQSSYQYKHIADKHLGYVTNGEFIAAAIMAGYPYKEDDGLNAYFGMSKRSWERMRKTRPEWLKS